jgi:hypothetical protein
MRLIVRTGEEAEPFLSGFWIIRRHCIEGKDQGPIMLLAQHHAI